MDVERNEDHELIIGLVSVSDRASRGEYVDEGIPALRSWCEGAVTTPATYHERLIPDDRYTIEETLRELVDRRRCNLVLTTGGTGPSLRDVTPEATLAVGTREMPGFAEQMRRVSLYYVPTAILSRQVAVLREVPGHAALIVNLPGRPKAIAETLGGVIDEQGRTVVDGIFAAIPYCIDLIGGPYMETDPAVVKAFRPKNAVKPDARQPQATSAPVRPAAPATAAAAPAWQAPKPAPQAPAPRPAPSQAPASGPNEFVLSRPTVQPSPTTSAAPITSNQRWATDVPTPTHSYASTFGAAQTPYQNRPEGKPTMSPEAIARRSVQHVQMTPPPGGVAVFGARPKTGQESLELLVKEPEDGFEPRCTVIWLHGLGADAHDFETLPQQLLEFGAPSARFIFPNAPKRHLGVQPDLATRAWYDILTNDFVSQEDLKGLSRMHLQISQIINSIVSAGLLAENIFIGGFSQGAAMALYSSLRQARTLAGCIALSGYLPAPQLIEKDMTPGGRATPVFMAHGSFDSVVSPVLAQKGADILDAALDTLIWREYNMDHELCPEELTHIAQFMNTALQN